MCGIVTIVSLVNLFINAAQKLNCVYLIISFKGTVHQKINIQSLCPPTMLMESQVTFRSPLNISGASQHSLKQLK